LIRSSVLIFTVYDWVIFKVPGITHVELFWKLQMMKNMLLHRWKMQWKYCVFPQAMAYFWSYVFHCTWHNNVTKFATRIFLSLVSIKLFLRLTVWTRLMFSRMQLPFLEIFLS